MTTDENNILSEVMTVPKAAKAIGISKMTLYRWIDQDKVKTVSHGGILFIRREEVERLRAEKVNGAGEM